MLPFNIVKKQYRISIWNTFPHQIPDFTIEKNFNHIVVRCVTTDKGFVKRERAPNGLMEDKFVDYTTITAPTPKQYRNRKITNLNIESTKH